MFKNKYDAKNLLSGYISLKLLIFADKEIIIK